MKNILIRIGIGIVCLLTLLWLLIMIGEKESRERLFSFAKDGIGWGIFWFIIFIRIIKDPLNAKDPV